MQKALLFLLLLNSAQAFQASSQTFTDIPPLEPILSQVPHDYPVLQQVLRDPKPYRVQILYTQIDRDANNEPSLAYYQYGLDEQRYFYPASTVKLPIALLALEWLAEQQVPGLTAETTMLTGAATDWQTERTIDPSASSGLPSIAHDIKKIFLVSDNEGSNRLYELLGPAYINQRFTDKGLLRSLINHRLSVSLSNEQNRQVNPVRFIDSSGKELLRLPARTSAHSYLNSDKPSLGRAYIRAGKLITAPMDFSDKNRFSLADFDSTIKRLVFPQLFAPEQRFNLRPSDRDLVLRYMAMLPPDSINPSYDAEQYPGNYAKFFMFGGKAQQIPEHIRLFSKSGWAYGHIIDGAYIVDLQNQIEFFITAVIYANENDILNDDLYQREQIAIPFLQQLGQYLYQYELQRPRKFSPDLTEVRQLSAAEPEFD